MFLITAKQLTEFSNMQLGLFADQVFHYLLEEGLADKDNRESELGKIFLYINQAKDHDINDKKNVFRFVRFQKIMSQYNISTQEKWVTDILQKVLVSPRDRMNILEHEMQTEVMNNQMI